MSDVIGVVGAGTMGNGIAQVAARAGYDVILHDVQEEFIQRGFAAIEKSLQRDVDKERISAEQKKEIVSRIESTTDLNALSEASLVIEAVVEDLAVALQGSLLVRYSPPAVADAFCAARLAGEGGRVFGTLPGGVDARAIIDRAFPV